MSQDPPVEVVAVTPTGIKRLPLFFRKFVYTTIVTFAAGLLVMSVADLYEAGWNALAIALSTAALKSAVENAGDFYSWLRDVLGLPASLLNNWLTN